MPEDKKIKTLYDDTHDILHDDKDPLMGVLHRIIKLVVKVLAVIMVAVIVWGVVDVMFVLYQRLMTPPFLLLKISDILTTFGAFLAVLIVIDLFVNIALYLKTDMIPVKLVVATALMAISRKVIIFDYEKITPRAHLCDSSRCLGWVLPTG